MADGEDDLVEGLGDKNGSNAVSNAKNKASQMKQNAKQVKDIMKKVSKKFNNASAKIGKAVAKIAAKLGPALPYIAFGLLILFVIIGICGFLATMPGMLTGKLKEFAQNVSTWWQSLYKTAADASVKKEDVVGTAEYIRSMGYDLIGYGFIPANELDDDISGSSITADGHLVGVGTEAGQYSDKYGIFYSTGGDNDGADGTFETAGTIVDFYNYPKQPDTSLIRTYLLSNNRMFSIRNYDNDDSVLSWIHDIFVDNDENWSKGLISLYYATDLKATGPYQKVDLGYIEANPTTKTLNVKVGWHTNEMQFSMDGWSGRYGLSLEFLLSLHLGTMAPELVTTMARSFDTEVQVYLGELTTDVWGYYREEDGSSDYITYQDINNYDEGFVPWIGNKDARNIMYNLKIKSRRTGTYACTYASGKKIWAKANGSANGDSTIPEYTEWLDVADTETYNKLVTKVNAGDFDNIIKRYTDENKIHLPGIEDWKTFFASGMYTSHSDILESDPNWEKFRIVLASINQMVNVIRPGFNVVKSDGSTINWNSYYSNWTDEDGQTPSQIGAKYHVDMQPVSSVGADPLAPNVAYRLMWDTTAERLDGDVTTGPGSGLKGKIPFKEISGLGANECAEFNICTFTAPGANPKKLRISMFVTSGGTANLDFSVIMYEEDPVTSSTPRLCSDDIATIGKVCESCENYVEHIRNALKKITKSSDEFFDMDFKTYTPYIARVVDSWFRDTFFVVPSTADEAINDVYDDDGKRNKYGSDILLTKGNIEYVKVDEEYLKETDEYWSKYETYDDPTTGEKYYKLYQLNNDGTLSSSGDNYIRCTDDDGKEVYKNLSTGATEPVENSNLKLVKKAETGADITSGWTQTVSGVWSVYSNNPVDTSNVYRELQVGNGSPDAIKSVAEYVGGTGGGTYRKCFYYTMDESAAIQQKEDARRGMTNPAIKQMFKIRKYYIYDGSEEKAIKIYKDWKRVVDDYGDRCYSAYQTNSYFTAKYGDGTPLDARKIRAVEMALDDYYYYNSGPFSSSGSIGGGDPRQKHLIGNITINKDTLNAFSILENTKTLDADYQYRDFKELIVELDYFDKEDLSDKPSRVLEWIIPSCTDKWPYDVIDKSENYYGTLIHSKDAITELKTKLVNDGTFETEEALEQSELGAAVGYEIGKDVISPVTGEIINCGKYSRVNTDYVAANYPDETVESLKAQGRFGEISEEVGFIQIKVLNLADINAIKDIASGSVTVDSQTLYYDDIWQSYYDEYTGVCAGHIITIEGIDPLAVDLDGLKAAITSRATLQPNETPKLVDKNAEKKNKALEKAKVEKLPAKLEVNGRLFVTEGAIIGKTAESSLDPKCSYTRLILRDEKLGVVENLEDYFDFNDN